MRKLLFALIIFTVFIISSCKKDKNNSASCLPDAITIQVITKRAATVNISGDKVYLMEKGAIDGRLIPCNLPDEFKVSKLDVIVSGEIKATVNLAMEPCCSSDFVITEITK